MMSMFRCRLLVLLVSSLIALHAQSVLPAATMHQLHHTSFTFKDGLYGEVRALAQTKDGFLWVGTSQGLYRFDGTSFENYKSERGVLPDVAVTSLLVVDDGSLWVGFEHGAVAHITSGVSTAYDEHQNFPYGSTRALARTPDGAIWAAATGSLARFDGSRWQKIRYDWNYPERSASGLFVDRQGTLWVGTSERLVYLPAHAHRFQDGGFKGAWIVAIAQSADGVLWASDGNTDTVQSFCTPLESGTCHRSGIKIPIGSWAVLTPRSGGLWFATETLGARYLADTALSAASDTARVAESFGPAEGLSGRLCSTLLEDSDGDIWVGTKGGLDRFRSWNMDWRELGTDEVHLLPGDNGKPWFTPVTLPLPLQVDDRFPVELRSLIDQPVLAATRSNRGNIWLFTHKKLFRWSSGNLTEIPRPHELQDGNVYSIAEDRKGVVWLSIGGHGEYRYVSGTWSFVPVPGAEPDIAATNAYVDDTDRLWLVYDARRLVSRIENGKATTYSSVDEVALGHPNVITGQGSKLLVGGTQGLAYFDGRRFKRLVGSHDEAFSSVFDILFTPKDGAWISTVNGIIHISSNDLAHCISTSCNSIRFDLVAPNSELPQPLVGPSPPAYQPTSVRDEKGGLWFAVHGGAVRVDPRALAPNPIPPSTIIKSFQADGKSYSTKDLPAFHSKLHSLQIDYTAPSLRLNQQMRYRYRLDHWDTDWQDVGLRKQAIYSNLGPGTYVFQVISCNAQGVCSTASQPLTFLVTPAFYQTGWFRALLLCIAASSLWFLYRLRLKIILQRSNALLLGRMSERERIAQDLHDTFLQSVQGLMLKFQTVASEIRTDDPARARLESTLVQSDQVLLEGRRLISTLHGQEHPPNALLESLREIGTELQLLHPTQFSVEFQGVQRELNAAVCEEILSFGREALTNAFRHAEATQISLVLRLSPRDLRLTVHDDGIGIEETILAKGFRAGHWGLRTMRDRAKRLGARSMLKSSPQMGTTIELVVPAELAYANRSPHMLRSLFKARS